MSNMTTIVSVASDGTQGDRGSYNPSISGDGRYVVFESKSSNLVAGDGVDIGPDILVHDREMGLTEMVSIPPSGILWDYGSFNPVINGDGKYVAFENYNRLVEGRNIHDIYVHNLESGDTRLVSVSSNGTLPNGSSWRPAISDDGRYVAFASEANNLVPGDTNDITDIFVHELSTGETSRVSVASDGTQGNGDSGLVPGGSDPPRGGVAISADGRYVAFESEADNLVPADGNNSADVFVHDRLTGETTRASNTSEGIEGNKGSFAPDISADGRYVAFQSFADNLVPEDTTRGYTDIFIHDRSTGQIVRASVASDGTEGNTYSFAPFISGDGRYVAFWSEADNLVSEDTNENFDVFVHDLLTGETSRVSVASDGTQGNDDSPIIILGAIDISGDGSLVVFDSEADNLVPGDANSQDDVFVHERDLMSTLNINDVTLNEANSGTTAFNFTVTLSPVTTQTVTVDYATSDGTAIGEEDYTATNGTLEFAPGETQKTITVQVIGDLDVEEDESFRVNLSDASNAAIANNQGTATITNDDSTSELQTIELFRFRNTTFDTGTYVFVGAEERDAIQSNPDLNQTFELEGVQEDGTVDPAFKASTEPGDDLIPFYRLRSLDVPGTYLFVSTGEYEAIFDEDSVQKDRWVKEGLDAEENDIAEFYLYDREANLGLDFNRFQNTQNNTFLYVGPEETAAIESNPDLSNLFTNQGGAFESLI